MIPMQNLQDYTNRKMFQSVVLQAVCDNNMRFIDISVDWPGSMHDETQEFLDSGV